MTLEYGVYFFLTLSLSQLNRVWFFILFSTFYFGTYTATGRNALEYVQCNNTTNFTSQHAKYQCRYSITKTLLIWIEYYILFSPPLFALFDQLYVLQEVGPSAPLIVFFHYNTVPNTNSNSTDSTFVQKLVELFRGLISCITLHSSFISTPIIY